MSNVALVRAPYIEPFPPDIGMAYLAAVLKDRGHRVSVFDLNIDLYSRVEPGYQERWATSDERKLFALSREVLALSEASIKRFADTIVEESFNIVGFSIWHSNINCSLLAARQIKEKNPSLPIVFGGPECYPLWSGNSLIESPYVDIVVYGEGEFTLGDIVDNLDRYGSLRHNKGFLIKKEGRIVDMGPEETIHNLELLPFPDFSVFDLDRYPTEKGLFILFNRGCVYKCSYCSLPGTTPAYRKRSAKSLVCEIKHQIKRHPGITRFFCASAALNADLNTLSEFCDLIIEEGLEVSWGGYAAIRKMDIKLLEKMKIAGCECLNFGMESSSDRILKQMNKRYDSVLAGQLIKDTHEAGISSIRVNFIFGFPGETEEDFRKTLAFVGRNRKYIRFIGSSDTCWVEPYSAIHSLPNDFEIKINNPLDRMCKDRTSLTNGNTREQREERKRQFSQFIHQLGY